MKAAVPAPALPPVAHQPPPEQNMPLVDRPYFRTSWRNWETLLMNAAIRKELKAHCVLCHFWVADYQHIKQHQRRTHSDILTTLQQDVVTICRTFKSQLRGGSNCLWCGNRVWAPISARCCISLFLLLSTVAALQRTMPLDQSMRQGPKGLSSGINPETDIFEYVHFANNTSRKGQASDPPENQPNKRPRPEQAPARQRRPLRGGGRPFGTNPRGPDQDTVKTLARIIIRQEDQLAELRGDKGFFLFLREDPEVSVLPALIQISKDWHVRQEAGDHALKSPLRTLLMACLIKRLRELMVLMTATPESVQKLQAAEWMDQAERTFFKWSHQDKKLVRDPERGTIAQPALLEKIDYLLANLRRDVVQKFNSRPRLYEMGDNLPETATFFLSISLHGPIAQQVHEHLVQLIGVSALMLVGASLKREIPRRSPAVQQLAETVFR